MAEFADPPVNVALVIPDHQIGNPCYLPDRAWEHGYSDGRWYSGQRRPGAVRGRDVNYDLGLAAGMLDKRELDSPRPGRFEDKHPDLCRCRDNEED